jgi:hypothetical protein
MYSNEEKMHIMHLYHANQNMRNVSDVFSVTYPDRPIHPSEQFLTLCISKFNLE